MVVAVEQDAGTLVSSHDNASAFWFCVPAVPIHNREVIFLKTESPSAQETFHLLGTQPLEWCMVCKQIKMATQEVMTKLLSSVDNSKTVFLHCTILPFSWCQ